MDLQKKLLIGLIKSKFVLKGYRWKENLDYFDAYSLITRIISIRVLVSQMLR